MMTKKQPTKNDPCTPSQDLLKTSRPTSCCNSTTTDAARGAKTRIIIKYDVGFKNTLFLRGKGANLNWEKGIPMKNTKADEWVWETDANFPAGEFKVLINDHVYETGRNHPIQPGATIQYTPRF